LSKNELIVEGTTRTAGTADTTQKTFDSANNSNSTKGNIVFNQGRPPRGSIRPTTGSEQPETNPLLRFYP
jgi:hypothetical protein